MTRRFLRLFNIFNGLIFLFIYSFIFLSWNFLNRQNRYWIVSHHVCVVAKRYMDSIPIPPFHCVMPAALVQDCNAGRKLNNILEFRCKNIYFDNKNKAEKQRESAVRHNKNDLSVAGGFHSTSLSSTNCVKVANGPRSSWTQKRLRCWKIYRQSFHVMSVQQLFPQSMYMVKKM